MSSEKQKFILGIGAPRCGTTWAYQNILDATNVYMPPLKELRYFCGKRSEEERVAGHKKIMQADDARPFDREFAKIWIESSDGDPDAYRKLFPAGQPVGEISPIYSVMLPKRVKVVQEALDTFDASVFYFMRNPLERDMSHIIFSMHRLAKRTQQRPLEDYEKFIRNEPFIRRSNYRRTVRIWKNKFQKDLKLFYYDDLKDNPEAYFAKFCERLDIEFDETKVDKRPKNKSGAAVNYANIEIPKAIQNELRERYLKSVPLMKFLPKRIEDSWMSKIENLK